MKNAFWHMYLKGMYGGFYPNSGDVPKGHVILHNLYPKGHVMENLSQILDEFFAKRSLQITGMIFRHALVLKISDKDQGIKRYSGNEL